jgi:hypothetical protein
MGKTAKELRLERCLKTNDELRDSLSAEELKAVERLEMRVGAHLEIGRTYKVDIGLIVAVPDFQERKRILIEYYGRQGNQKVIA